MIICHKHRFIFLKPFKVAGSSFEFALSSILSKDDFITKLSKDEEKKRFNILGIKEQNNKLAFFKLLSGLSKQNKRDLQKFNWPRIFNPHSTAEDVKNYIGDKIWNDYKKISIIRNPWDYLLSFYHWNPSGAERLPFKHWIFKNRHLIGANNDFYKINDECVIDIFLRYEHLLTDIDKLPIEIQDCSNIRQILTTTNFKSGFRNKNKSEELKMLNQASSIDKVIEAFCDLEINHFGYLKPK